MCHRQADSNAAVQMKKIFFLQLHTFIMHTCFNSIHIKLFVGKSMKMLHA